jgi:hypothetical protein
MSFLLCPTCGKLSSLKHFHPGDFDDDVYTVDVQGLGKGRGFKTTGQASILGKNEVTEKIADRCLVLLGLFIDHDVVTEEEVRKRLGLSVSETIIDQETDETTAVQEEREASDQAIDELVGQIAEALGESPDSYEPGNDDGEDEKTSLLRYWVGRLIDDYMAAKADLENHSDA